MATHSSILAWRIPWTEEPGGLQSMGSQRVGHNWATNKPGGEQICPQIWESVSHPGPSMKAQLEGGWQMVNGYC